MRKFLFRYDEAMPDCRRTCAGATFPPMSTLAEIEDAIAQLPPTQWTEIRRWMDAHAPKAATPEALNVFRQLQDAVRLTAEGAAAWKDAVADARR